MQKCLVVYGIAQPGLPSVDGNAFWTYDKLTTGEILKMRETIVEITRRDTGRPYELDSVAIKNIINLDD